MPSTATCTLSLVMQTCSGMSSACSFKLCLYATRSMNGTRTWKPARRVLLYLPSASTTDALCCGTTTAVRAITKTTSPATASTAIRTLASTGLPLAGRILFGAAYVEHEALRTLDPEPRAGRDRIGAHVVRRPGRAAQLRAAPRTGRERLARHAGLPGEARLEARDGRAQPRVESAAEGHERQHGQPPNTAHSTHAGPSRNDTAAKPTAIAATPRNTR